MTGARSRWRALTDEVRNGVRYRILHEGEPLAFRKLFDLFATDSDFAGWYSRLLATADPEAYFWEHPALSSEAMDQATEFVLIDAPSLAARQADVETFRSHFANAGDNDIAVFDNIGGDALLLAPRPAAPIKSYAHLASFVRQGPDEQIRNLWKETARQMSRLVGREPLWLSTSGLGVAWLHVRFDRDPKYYQHTAYKSAGRL
jgi:hypothetical protein